MFQVCRRIHTVIVDAWFAVEKHYQFEDEAYKCNITLYGIQSSLNGLCSITEVKQRRARFIIGSVTAWDCQVLNTVVGLREPRKSDGSSD